MPQTTRILFQLTVCLCGAYGTSVMAYQYLQCYNNGSLEPRLSTLLEACTPSCSSTSAPFSTLLPPSLLDLSLFCQVANIRSDAMFILLVEKDAAFMRLAEDRFYKDYPCIILTAKGQPDVATRWVEGWKSSHAAVAHPHMPHCNCGAKRAARNSL